MIARSRHIVSRILAWSLIALMFTAVVNVLWQVFTRWVLNDPSSYTEELARYLLIWVGLLGAAYAAGEKMHLAIDLLPARLTGTKKHLLEIAIEALVLLFALSVMVIGGYRLVSLTLLMGQRSAALGVQLGYVYLVLPFAGILIVFYAAVSILERIRALRGQPADLVEPDRSTQKPID
jgi:TRAP-type C4-dicarboxylate transport system permease small subunit